MKFTEKYTVRWHDTDAHRNMRPSKIVEYMQETANRQCEMSGLPLDKLRDKRGLGFILGALSLRIQKPLHSYDEIEVSTWCTPARGYIFNRYFEIRCNGDVAAFASSTWVLLDINKKTIVRISPDDDMNTHFYYDDPIDTALLPKKPRVAKYTSLCKVGERRIVYSDIDYNMHMNNTHYPDMICDHLLEMTGNEHKTVSSMSLSYLKEAALGDNLSVYRSDKDDKGIITVQARTGAGDVCFEALVTLSD